jgi:hypothetical protein
MHSSVLQGSIVKQNQGQEGQDQVNWTQDEEQEREASSEGQNFHDKCYRCSDSIQTRSVRQEDETFRGGNMY